jgi:hypothetical protein
MQVELAQEWLGALAPGEPEHQMLLTWQDTKMAFCRSSNNINRCCQGAEGITLGFSVALVFSNSHMRTC